MGGRRKLVFSSGRLDERRQRRVGARAIWAIIGLLLATSACNGQVFVADEVHGPEGSNLTTGAEPEALCEALCRVPAPDDACPVCERECLDKVELALERGCIFEFVRLYGCDGAKEHARTCSWLDACPDELSDFIFCVNT